MTKPKRVLSGMRPTGRLHLGHFFGALSNWLKLQEEYECFFFVADWHALTTHYEDTSSIAENTLQVAMDWLSVGLDPAKATMFIQSSVVEHAELHVLLSMITPLSWLERVPTYKEQIENLKDRDLGTYGFLGYPLLQSADIVIYDADFVPVGEDQVPHVELTREIVRAFNAHFGFEVKDLLFEPANLRVLKSLYGEGSPLLPDGRVPLNALKILFRKEAREDGLSNFIAKAERVHQGASTFFHAQEVLHEPGHLLTQTPRLPGLDGRRMAKSYGNAIWLS